MYDRKKRNCVSYYVIVVSLYCACMVYVLRDVSTKKCQRYEILLTKHSRMYIVAHIFVFLCAQSKSNKSVTGQLNQVAVE